MIECVSLLCEILAILILMHSLLGKKMTVDKKMIAVMTANVLIFYLINFCMFPRYMQVLVYFLLFVYLRMEFFNEKIIRIVGAFLCTYFILCGIEIPIYYVLEILEIDKKYVLLSNILVLICVLLIIRIFDLEKLYLNIIKTKPSTRYIVLGCGVLFVIFILVLKFMGGFSFLEILLGNAVFLIVIIFSYQRKMQRDIIEMKERQIKWLDQCNDSFDQLITDVRSRQHEFNNRIDAICGLMYSCKTYDELVQQLGMYTDKIFQEIRFNKLLTMECPPIIKGFLYYRFCRALDEELQINYNIILDNNMSFSVMYDISEIIGILFDNACEAIKKNNYPKHIGMSIRNMESGIQILVENICSYTSYEEISHFTKKGYSTKGEGRGYGLYNVKKLMKKYNGNIIISNKEKTGENWLQILVELFV